MTRFVLKSSVAETFAHSVTEALLKDKTAIVYSLVEFASARPSQFNASFPIARPTHVFGKKKSKKKIPESLVKKQVL